MCKTSFITVTDTQMHYLATNVRQNFGFHHPPDTRTAFEGVWLIPKTRSSSHSSGKMVIFFHILKRNIWKVCAIPPKFSVEWRPSKWQKRVKKSSKEATKLAFHGSFGGIEFGSKNSQCHITYLSIKNPYQNYELIQKPGESIDWFKIHEIKQCLIRFFWI